MLKCLRFDFQFSIELRLNLIQVIFFEVDYFIEMQLKY